MEIRRSRVKTSKKFSSNSEIEISPGIEVDWGGGVSAEEGVERWPGWLSRGQKTIDDRVLGGTL